MPDPTEPATDPSSPAGETSRDAAQPLTPEDFYYEGPYLVFTAAYHLKRGYCCNSGCRHCPYR
ncbi:DUF5522 domain-containing protein [Edaphobacter bradus]|uniref:DUF5522 domain-containing protein n=1 Tax=Edaphobacter bradus TaxID=2259016 RepID=UPI0021DFA8EA|nr:DUF5522 domain-containing protein [Edaphobacter bradus]